jgi:hypothetical protein
MAKSEKNRRRARDYWIAFVHVYDRFGYELTSYSSGSSELSVGHNKIVPVG